jgi:hypothetical protein
MRKRPAPMVPVVPVTNHVDFQIEIVPADGTRLPMRRSGDFGRSPLLRSTQSRQSA